MSTITVAPFVLCRLLVGLRYVAQKLLTEVDGWGSSKNGNPFLHAHPPTQPHVLSAKEWLLFKLMKVSSSHQQRHHRERLPGSRIIIIATGILRGSTLEWNMALIPVIIASWLTDWLTVWPSSSNDDESQSSTHTLAHWDFQIIIIIIVILQDEQGTVGTQQLLLVLCQLYPLKTGE